MNRWIILDRDGVINADSDAYIKSLDEWRPLPGAIDAMARLHRAGYRLAVITNQSGLARGLFQRSDLDAMHQRLAELLAARGARIDALYFCPHGPDDDCDCRKPAPGMFLRLAAEHGVDLGATWALGDSYRDLQAAETAGARPALVRTGKGERTLAAHPDLPDRVPVFASLAEFADRLLEGDL